MDCVQHASHEGPCAWEHFGCKGEFADERLGVATCDDAFAAEGTEERCELADACRGAGEGLLDGVELHSEERQPLRGALGLVCIDDETELADDGLSESQVALHIWP
jgi:hypothetical protein